MIQRGEVEVLIVQNPDRLSRNVDHTLLLLSEVQEAEIELHTVTHGHLSQAKQPLPETLEAGIAECEQELPPFCRLDSEPTSGA
jgi:DNA invertase Pin-like site-specific DNA recombinase